MAPTIHIRLDDHEDQDIIAWRDAQENITAAVKAAIRLAIASDSDGDGDPDYDHNSNDCEASPALDLEAIKRALADVLADHNAVLTLSAIRAVVEAALVEQLAGLALADLQADPNDDPELGAKIDNMF